MSTDSAASSPTLRQLLNGVNLTETFDQIGGRSRKTTGTTRREKLVRPKLTTVTFTNNEALDKEVQDFLAENGDIPASEDTIEIFAGLRVQEKVLVAKKKKTWTHETTFTNSLAHLLEVATCCVTDIVQHNKYQFPVLDTSNEDGAWAIPDCTSKVNKGVGIPFDLFNLLAELKTVCVLREGVIEYILQHSVPGESWAEGKFDPDEAPSGQRVRYKKVAESMLRQVYLQMVPRTAIRIDAIPATSASPNSHSPHTTVINTASMSSTSSNSLISVSPLYNCLSNYNKTLIVRRSSDLSVGAIDIFGTYEPQDLLPIFVTIIYKQFKENCELQAVGRLREIEDNQYELQEVDDNDADVDVDVNVKRDGKGDDKDDKGDHGDHEDHEDDEDDEANNARRKRQRKAADDDPGGRGGSRDRGRRGRTHKGNERTGHQKGGSSGGASNMSLIKQDEMWMRKPGNRLHFITYDYDIRGYGGIKYIFSDDRTLLSTWTPQRRAGNSEIPPTITPHITIVARLAAGVSGETFIAKCDGGPHLVWKEIPLDDDHLQYARTEVMMYDGPLAALQGTLVPALYGVFHEPEDNCAVLLMEYVGKPLGNDWNEVSPGHRALADELRGKLRAAGIEHGDWAPRNICLRHGEVRVIDFTHSYLIAPVPLMRKSSRLQKLRPEIDLT